MLSGYVTYYLDMLLTRLLTMLKYNANLKSAL